MRSGCWSRHALFSLMGAMVKVASQQYGVPELVFYRSLIGVVSLYAFVRWRALTLATPVAMTHLTRGVVGTAALALWFYATERAAARHGDDAQLHLAALPRGVRWSVSRCAAATRDRLATGGARSLVGFVGVVFAAAAELLQDEQVDSRRRGLVSGVLSAIAYWYVRTARTARRARMAHRVLLRAVGHRARVSSVPLIGRVLAARCARSGAAAGSRRHRHAGATGDDARLRARAHPGRRQSAVSRRSCSRH